VPETFISAQESTAPGAIICLFASEMADKQKRLWYKLRNVKANHRVGFFAGVCNVRGFAQ
jgi:hypothetical protein